MGMHSGLDALLSRCDQKWLESSQPATSGSLSPLEAPK